MNGRTTDTRDSLSKKQSNNYLNTRNQITMLSQNQSRKGNNNHSEYQNQNFDYDKMMTMHNQMQNMSLTNKVGMNQDTKALSQASRKRKRIMKDINSAGEQNAELNH